MALITKAIKGTQDTLPMDSHKVRFLEATLADIAGNYGFREIRTPVFEHTELFNRSVGDTTDVGRSVYASAIRADMSVGDAEFQGPTPFYQETSRIVKQQYMLHPDNVKEGL